MLEGCFIKKKIHRFPVVFLWNSEISRSKFPWDLQVLIPMWCQLSSTPGVTETKIGHGRVWMWGENPEKYGHCKHAQLMTNYVGLVGYLFVAKAMLEITILSGSIPTSLAEILNSAFKLQYPASLPEASFLLSQTRKKSDFNQHQIFGTPTSASEKPQLVRFRLLNRTVFLDIPNKTLICRWDMPKNLCSRQAIATYSLTLHQWICSFHIRCCSTPQCPAVPLHVVLHPIVMVGFCESSSQKCRGNHDLVGINTSAPKQPLFGVPS